MSSYVDQGQLWVSVFAASFVQQYSDEVKRHVFPPVQREAMAERFAKEAETVADLALAAFRRTYFHSEDDRM